MDKILRNSRSDKSPIVQKFLSSSPLSPQNIEQLRKNIRAECKLRLKNKRRELFNKSRTDLEHIVSNEFQKIRIDYKQELDSISALFDERDLKVLQDIEQEILNEQVEWFDEELTKMIEENESIEDQYARLNAVMCPLCLGGVLEQCNNVIVCNKCNNQVSHNMQLEDFAVKLNALVEQHETICSAPPSFTLAPNESNLPCLLMNCMECQNWCFV